MSPAPFVMPVTKANAAATATPILNGFTTGNSPRQSGHHKTTLGLACCWVRVSMGDHFTPDHPVFDPHQLGKPDEVVGSGSQHEHPAVAGKATVTGLAQAGGRLGFLNALAHPLTDRIAWMAGRVGIFYNASPILLGRQPQMNHLAGSRRRQDGEGKESLGAAADPEPMLPLTPA